MKKLFGIWQLTQFCDISNEGERTERDYKITGRLIYSKPNTVFVGLAYYKKEYHSNFYSGHFNMDLTNSKVFHKIIVSSDQERNNSVLERSFRFQDGQLILTGNNNLGNTVELVWERES